MNSFTISKRTQMLQLLVEGNSMRSIERIVSCSINTVAKQLCEVGAACAARKNGVKSFSIRCEIASGSIKPGASSYSLNTKQLTNRFAAAHNQRVS